MTPAELQAFLEVDRRAVHVWEALAVDEQRESVALERQVALALLVERELVLKARAASPAHAHAQAGEGRVLGLGGEELVDLFGALVAQRDHRFRKYSALPWTAPQAG